MSIVIKTKEELNNIRESGRRVAKVVDTVLSCIKPGVTTKELDELAYSMVVEMGDTPSFLNYAPAGVDVKFPATLCVSVNDVVVHGIPSDDLVIKEGDVVTVDCGINHKGGFSDHARTIIVAGTNKKVRRLVSDTEEALRLAVLAAVPGGFVGDIGHAVESFVEGRYGIVKALAGHGVGKAVHEDPYVPNFGRRGSGDRLVPGMVLAIEPMLTLGGEEVVFHDDGYTVTTADKSLSAHFEHTVIITEDGPEVVTLLS